MIDGDRFPLVAAPIREANPGEAGAAGTGRRAVPGHEAPGPADPRKTATVKARAA